MNKQKNIEKLLFKTFDEDIKGADIYNNDGSMWIIFTEKRKWIVEFTKAGTLWYNYRHFTDILIYFGMELDEGAEYIKKWYEERFLFKPKIVEDSIKERLFFVEDTIDNGVKNASAAELFEMDIVEDTIQNGIKDTKSMCGKRGCRVDYTIQNGLKRVYTSGESKLGVEDTIQNGVKVVKSMKQDRNSRHGILKIEDEIPIHIYMDQVQDVVQNGVKHCEDGDWLDGDERFEDIIENGEKL